MKRIDGGAKKGKAIAVELDGETVPAREGEPVACALLAAGETTFARSIKYGGRTASRGRARTA